MHSKLTFGKSILLVCLVFVSFTGCAQLGLIQPVSMGTEARVGRVRVVGPVLLPQRITIPADGISLGEIVAAANRPGSSLVAFGTEVQMVYRQRGAMRLFVPADLVQQSAFGSIQVVNGDVIGCLPLTQTPIFSTTTGGQVLLSGALNTGTLNSSHELRPLRVSGGEVQITVGDNAAFVVLQTELVNLGITPEISLNAEPGAIPDVCRISRFSTDGYVEQYLIPYYPGITASPSPLQTQMKLEFDQIPMAGGTEFEFTLAETLPELIVGNVMMLSSAEQDLSGVATESAKSCHVQVGPLLRPYSAAARGMFSQSTANVRRLGTPIQGLFRVAQ